MRASNVRNPEGLNVVCNDLVDLLFVAFIYGVEEVYMFRSCGVRWTSLGKITCWPRTKDHTLSGICRIEAQQILHALRSSLPWFLHHFTDVDPKPVMDRLGLHCPLRYVGGGVMPKIGMASIKWKPLHPV